MLNDDKPAETPAEMAETVAAERVTGARRVGLSKILGASLVIVLIGFAVVAGLQAG